MPYVLARTVYNVTKIHYRLEITNNEVTKKGSSIACVDEFNKNKALRTYSTWNHHNKTTAHC